ncbi:MAG: mechanosensitive ion channel domain-containing protein [Spirochaetota bacterium]
MDALFVWIEKITGLHVDHQEKVGTTIVVILVILFFRVIVNRLLWRGIENIQVRYHWQKTMAYAIYIIGVFVLGRVWFDGFNSIATVLGLVSAGIAFALQDIIKSMAGWVFLLWRRPFLVGDRIQVGSIRGDVIDIRLFKFSLLEIGNWVEADQSTGRVLHLPNTLILTETIANYTSGFEYLWNEIGILLTFESDWRKAKELVLKIGQKHSTDLLQEAQEKLKEASKKYMIFYANLTPIVYTSVKESGVSLSLRYLTEPRKRRIFEEKIWEDILDSFAKEDAIDFAYPTQRIYFNDREGKAGLRSHAT